MKFDKSVLTSKGQDSFLTLVSPQMGFGVLSVVATMPARAESVLLGEDRSLCPVPQLLCTLMVERALSAEMKLYSVAVRQALMPYKAKDAQLYYAHDVLWALSGKI